MRLNYFLLLIIVFIFLFFLFLFLFLKRTATFIICKETEPTHEEHTSETPIPSEKLNNFWIVTGNWVEKSIETQLKQRIQYLESLTDAQLQSAYIVTLNKNNLPTSGGAGLGLIDIMRRSDRQVFFEFKETESNFSVFMLKIKIN